MFLPRPCARIHSPLMLLMQRARRRGGVEALPTHVAGHLQVPHFSQVGDCVPDCISWGRDVPPAHDVGLVLVVLAPQLFHLQARKNGRVGRKSGSGLWSSTCRPAVQARPLPLPACHRLTGTDLGAEPLDACLADHTAIGHVPQNQLRQAQVCLPRLVLLLLGSRRRSWGGRGSRRCRGADLLQ